MEHARRRRGGVAGLGLAAALMLWASGLTAQEVGPVTGLPLPRLVSMKAAEANIRRGPSLTHRIDWVFRHTGMPLIVTGEFGHWRRVRDRDGLGGWVHYALLSGSRTVIVDDEMADLRAKPAPDAPLRARVERGAIARLGDCAAGWCRVSLQGYRGWMREAGLWGVALDRLDQAGPAEVAGATAD